MEGSFPPDRRMHGYKELEDKLDEHAEKLEEQLNQHAENLNKRLARFIRSGLFAFAMTGLLSAAAIVGFGFLLNEQGKQATEIQNQRREAILRSCGELNQRHDETIKAFHEVAEQESKKHPERAVQIKESTQGTLRLINALVPKQECQRIAALAVDVDLDK